MWFVNKLTQKPCQGICNYDTKQSIHKIYRRLCKITCKRIWMCPYTTGSGAHVIRRINTSITSLPKIKPSGAYVVPLTLYLVVIGPWCTVWSTTHVSWQDGNGKFWWSSSSVIRQNRIRIWWSDKETCWIKEQCPFHCGNSFIM